MAPVPQRAVEEVTQHESIYAPESPEIDATHCASAENAQAQARQAQTAPDTTTGHTCTRDFKPASQP